MTKSNFKKLVMMSLPLPHRKSYQNKVTKIFQFGPPPIKFLATRVPELQKQLSN